MYNEIIRFFNERRLKEGFTQLKAFTTETDNWKLQSELENLQTTYNYMLQYAALGQADPERKKMFNELLRSGYELADQAEFIRKYSKEYGSFSDKMRGFKVKPARSYQELAEELAALTKNRQINQLLEKENDDQELHYMEQHQLLADELFNKTWVATHWSKEDFKEASALIETAGVEAFDLSLLASAITLNLILYFDAYKLQLLVDLYLKASEADIKLRALVGIALGIYYHEERLALYPNLTQALDLLKEKEGFAEELHQVQLIFLISRETEKIDKKMREEIIPEMMKSPQFTNPDLKISEIDLNELEEKNPEWEDGINQISEHIRELGELQLEGVDTYMGTFSQLKNYPFFREAAHWFYPFNKEIPEIAGLFKEGKVSNKSILGVMLDSPVFCDSDKYSFCLTLKTIPEQQVQLMSTDISGQEEVIKDQLEGSVTAYGKNADQVLYRQYIQDIYRFFKLWSFRQQQHDIFTDKLTLWNCRILRPVIFKGNYEKGFADYLFTKGYLPESADLYQDLSELIPEDAEIRQKLGFAFQKMKRYDEAIQAYEVADLLRSNDVWTLKHLAQCHKRAHNYEKALKYFQQVETMVPDNLNLALQIGQCLATLRKYDEALTYFFKVEYLGKTPENARRAIGWCYFMTGKYDEAARFYEKIIHQDQAGPEDWLNYGHVFLAKQDIKQALDCYRKTAETCKTHEEFIHLFMADKKALLEQNIDEETLYITLDLV